jgi:hypothetical protein
MINRVTSIIHGRVPTCPLPPTLPHPTRQLSPGGGERGGVEKSKRKRSREGTKLVKKKRNLFLGSRAAFYRSPRGLPPNERSI